MSISGDWYNEFGSHLRITADPNGCVRGTYVSGTGHAVGAYPLVGRYEAAALPDHGAPLGWTVAWRNEQTDASSVTSWNGQYYEEGGGRICVTWLLTASASASNAWEATAVGQDVFTREPPSPERTEQPMRHAGAPTDPHPADELTPV
ncbi:avidin/streptavidin family protein [Streptomyces sp. NBC_00828]|uniref:avidin/streptavidin family protein n=1 Tax=Streptomyces sp. NBC_00828 TaxID=2903678 RepID=UPI00386CA4E6